MRLQAHHTPLWGRVYHSIGLSLRLLRRCLRITNFLELRKAEVQLRRITILSTDVKIRTPPGGASSTRESDVRALRQQFGVPKRLLRHTGMYGLFGCTKQS